MPGIGGRRSLVAVVAALAALSAPSFAAQQIVSVGGGGRVSLDDANVALGAHARASIGADGSVSVHYDIETTHDCVYGVLYRYCGAHWDDSRLPITVTGTAGNSAAVAASVAAWEAIWPGPAKTCNGAAAKVFCYRPGAANANGTTMISVWAPPAIKPACAGSGSDWVAVACSLPLDANKHLGDVDIWINGTKPIAQLQASPETETRSALGYNATSCGLTPPCQPVYDLQTVITHELGHVLGLGDIYGVDGLGAPGSCLSWPGDLSTVPNFRQTMHGCFVWGSTDRRTPKEGDLLGVLRVFSDTSGHEH